MANTIAGNVAGGNGEIVYLTQRHTAYSDAYGQSPKMTVTDASGNYSFTVLDNGPYFLYTAKSPLAKIKVLVNGDNHADVNFAS